MTDSQHKSLDPGVRKHLQNMEPGEHVTVWCPDLDIKQNEIVKTEDGWEVYTGFGRIELDWETIENEVEHLA